MSASSSALRITASLQASQPLTTKCESSAGARFAFDKGEGRSENDGHPTMQQSSRDVHIDAISEYPTRSGHSRLRAASLPLLLQSGQGTRDVQARPVRRRNVSIEALSSREMQLGLHAIALEVAELRTLDDANAQHKAAHMQYPEAAVAGPSAHSSPVRMAVPTDLPRRQLRQRKAAQLAPYTTEMQRYQRRLIRNDWQDAVVVSRELSRALKEKSRQAESAEPAAEGTTSSLSGVREGEEQRYKGVHIRGAHGAILLQREPMSSLKDNGNLALGSESASDGDSSHASSAIIARGPSTKRVRVVSGSSTQSASSTVTDHRTKSRKAAKRRQVQEASSDSNESMMSFIVDDVRPQMRTRRDREMPATDRHYRRLFKILRRTMPLRMAREHIEDLKDMHRENLARDGVEQVEAQLSSPSTSPSDSETSVLLPGQARKKVGSRNRLSDLPFALQGDSEDEVSPAGPSRSPSSAAGDPASFARVHRAVVDLSSDTSTSSGPEESDADGQDQIEFIHTWWDPRRAAHRLQKAHSHDRDGIDQMLCRNTAIPRRARYARMSRDGPSETRRSDLKRRPRSKPSRPSAETSAMLVARGSEEESIDASTGHRKSSHMSTKHHTISQTILSSAHERALPMNTAFVWDLSDDALLFDDVGPGTTRHAAAIAIPPANHVSPRAPSHIRSYKTTSTDVRRSRDAARGQHTPKKRRNVEPYRADYLSRTSPTRIRPMLDDASDTTASISLTQLESARRWESMLNVRHDFEFDIPISGLHLDTTGRSIAEMRERLLALAVLVESGSSEERFAPHVAAPSDHDLEGLLEIIEVAVQRVAREAAAAAADASDILPRYASHQAQLNFALVRWSETLCAWLELRLPYGTVANVAERCFVSLDSCANALAQCAEESSLLLLWAKILLAYRMRQEVDARIYHSAAEESANMEHTDYGALAMQTAKRVLLPLLRIGLHRTMSAARTGPRSLVSLESPRDVQGEASIAHWVHLMSVMCDFCSSTARQKNTPDGSFWQLLEESLREEHKDAAAHVDAVVLAEQTWYTVFALCFLSHKSPLITASVSASTLCHGSWSLIAYAISLVPLRYDDEVERKLSQQALRHRDGYIHAILHRVKTLLHRWHWAPNDVYAALSRLFACFDAHKLRDLPTERSHDFPRFLRAFDDGLLQHRYAETDEHSSAFQKLLSLLTICAKSNTEKAATDDKLRQKAAARFLSRFSSMRVMNFTTAQCPTAHERSALYNAYSFILVYLHVAPSTHAQRLVQMQQCLKISNADFESQIVGIRAMMYTAVLFRHHALPCQGIVDWFRAYFVRHTAILEDAVSGETDAMLYETRRKIREESLLLTAAIRAIQYVVKTGSLEVADMGEHSVDPVWLDEAWTSRLLTSRACLHIPSLTQEVLEFVRVCLLRRTTLTALTPASKPSSSEESQDSFIDVIDDDIFDDASMMDLAGYDAGKQESHPVRTCDTTSAAEAHIRAVTNDAELAQVLHIRISAALFGLMSALFDTKRANEYTLEHRGVAAGSSRGRTAQQQGIASYKHLLEQSRRSELAQLLVDCWARCAWLLVEEHKLRPWSTYLHHGAEDPRRIGDMRARRCATTRFYVVVLGLAAMSDVRPGLDTFYQEHLAVIWGQLLSSLASPTYTLQHLLLHHIAQLEQHRIASQNRKASADGHQCPASHLALVRGICIGEWPGTDSVPKLSMSEKSKNEIVAAILANLQEIAGMSAKMQSTAVVALSTMLVTIRRHVEEIRSKRRSLVDTPLRETGSDNLYDYLDLCRKTLASCEADLGETVRRGVAIELRKTTDAVASAAAVAGAAAVQR